MIVAGMPVRTTASIGVASTEAFGYDFDALIRYADGAVYAAKRAGRNRVTTADAGQCAADGHRRGRHAGGLIGDRLQVLSCSAIASRDVAARGGAAASMA